MIWVLGGFWFLDSGLVDINIYIDIHVYTYARVYA